MKTKDEYKFMNLDLLTIIQNLDNFVFECLESCKIEYKNHDNLGIITLAFLVSDFENFKHLEHTIQINYYFANQHIIVHHSDNNLRKIKLNVLNIEYSSVTPILEYLNNQFFEILTKSTFKKEIA